MRSLSAPVFRSTGKLQCVSVPRHAVSTLHKNFVTAGAALTANVLR
jgi:hypothetical protein